MVVLLEIRWFGHLCVIVVLLEISLHRTSAFDRRAEVLRFSFDRRAEVLWLVLFGTLDPYLILLRIHMFIIFFFKRNNWQQPWYYIMYTRSMMTAHCNFAILQNSSMLSEEDRGAVNLLRHQHMFRRERVARDKVYRPQYSMKNELVVRISAEAFWRFLMLSWTVVFLR